MMGIESGCNPPCVQRIGQCYKCKVIIVQKYEETKRIKWIIINASHGVWRNIALIFTYSWNEIGHPLKHNIKKVAWAFCKLKEIPKKFKVLNFEVKKPVNILGLFLIPVHCTKCIL
jgi:hypothetical protein